MSIREHLFQQVLDSIRPLVAKELWKTDEQKAQLIALRRSGLFNEEKYLQRYPDVKNYEASPLEHFIKYGLEEGRIPFWNKDNCLTKKTIIISLTSYPKRIRNVSQTISSLLEQNFSGRKKVILYLCEKEFPRKEESLPKELLTHISDGFDIHWVTENLRSYKKLIPALSEYPSNIIVTADDDIIYPQNWLIKLYNTHLLYPKCICTHRFRYIKIDDKTISPYNDWKLNYSPCNHSFLLFPTGSGGILYPPSALHPDVGNASFFMKELPFTDDIWFWAMAILKGTKIVATRNSCTELTTILGTQDDGLWRTINRYGNNDLCLKKVIKRYPQIGYRILK